MDWKPRFEENGFLDPGGAGPVPVTRNQLGAGPLQCTARIPNTRFDGVSRPGVHWRGGAGPVPGYCQMDPCICRLLLAKQAPTIALSQVLVS